MRRRLNMIVLALVTVSAVAGVVGFYARDREEARGTALAPVPAEAVRVVDGDSLELNGVRVRLVGIDALELDQPCRDGAGAEIACGRQARAALAALVQQGPLRCTGFGTDRFGRTLAVCTNGRGEEVNRAMVREGWALAFPGDQAYVAEERAAARARRGVHAWEFTRPQEWRRQQR